MVKAVRGMHDLLPNTTRYWGAIEQKIIEIFSAYCYQEIRTPIVESTDLFCRSIGEVTDIVEKEMYSFPDRNDDSLSLRPEGTASCVRACIEHGLLQTPQKLWYCGPMFRYERPQKGRQRQFHQFGAEVFGYDSVEIEVEMLLLTRQFWRELGLEEQVTLELNNIGSSEDRSRYKAALVEFLQRCKDQLDADSQRRLSTNPLRILDSKNPQTQALLNDAPNLSDYLSDDSKRRMDRLNELLAEQSINFTYNQRLVRGLDYYNDTVFEWVTSALGAQGTVCAGGRYDSLVAQLGGKATPAVGFGMGIERLFLLLESQQFSSLSINDNPDVFLMVGDTRYQGRAFAVADQIRQKIPDLSLFQQLSEGSLKSQFKKANKVGARYALVIGEDEFANNQFTVKDLNLGEQQQYSLEQLIDYLSNACSKQ